MVRADQTEFNSSDSPPLARCLGLDLPPGWWPLPAQLKAIEDAGFGWLQVCAPPVEMLADPRQSVRHAKALAGLLDCVRLEVVVHAPVRLRLGDPLHDRAFQGMLEYASQIRARHVIYHALDLPRRGRQSAAEELALEQMANWAAALGVIICLENLCPVYPGSSHICHDPLALRDLVNRIGGNPLAILFDLGHAHVVAELMGTDLLALLEPVAEHVAMFHLHDNFGARLGSDGQPAHDPLRLDLHLSPGTGDLPWPRLAPMLRRGAAPLIAEIEPASRWPARDTYSALTRLLAPAIEQAPAPIADAA